MGSRATRIENFAKIFSNSRYRAGVSQETMAAELCVSRKTIQNWENGVSSPSAFQLTEWFRVLNMNPTPYLFDYLNSEIRSDNTLTKEEKLQETFEKTMNELTVFQKRCTLYLLTGTYQGDPYAIQQLFVAYAHLPMQCRFSIANQICEMYKLCESANSLKDTQYVMPDIDALEKAIKAGRIAAINGNDWYKI